VAAGKTKLPTGRPGASQEEENAAIYGSGLSIDTISAQLESGP
jgi:hypothetical protein